uniref:Uncharacterized protein n=1 Tax=Aegilops tauschii subsp. strangulata TaxID=200361 RepID=A0A453CTJ2_AEGTS
SFNLVHPSNKLVDVVLTVPSVTTLDVVVPLLLQATERSLELEWPQEVVRLLKVWADGQDLVHKVLNADDVVLPQTLLDDFVVGQRDPLLVELSVTSLVDQLPDTLEVTDP